MGMKKQLQVIILHKSAQFISNVTKYTYPIIEYPPQYVKSQAAGIAVASLQKI